jgi:cell division protein FtsI (penicillin-binding protein 3)
VISVVIDEPVIEHYGGTVAGPVFRRIAAEALRHLGVPPAQSGAQLARIVKDLRSDKPDAAKPSSARAARRAADETGSPAAQAKQPLIAAGQVKVPTLAGLGARASLVALRQAGLEPALAGSGVVVEQSPEAGAVVARGAQVQVRLRERGLGDESDAQPAEETTLAAVSFEELP